MISKKQAPAFLGVPTQLASGVVSTVTLKLDPGIRLRQLNLRFGNDGATNPGQGLGTLKAPGMIDKIRILWGGKVQRQFTAVELNYLNSLNNPPGTTRYSAKTQGTLADSTVAAGTAGFRTTLPIFFAEPYREGWIADGSGNLVPEADLGAWNLDGTKEFTIEVDLIGRTSAGVAGILTAPSIAAEIVYDELRGGIGSILKYRRYSIGANATPQQIRDFDRNGGGYQSVHFFTTSDDKYVTSLKWTRNNQEVRQDTDRYQNDAELITAGMAPTALDTASSTTKQNSGVYNVVFDSTDRVQDILPVADAVDLTATLTFDSAPAGTMTYIVQCVGAPD